MARGWLALLALVAVGLSATAAGGQTVAPSPPAAPATKAKSAVAPANPATADEQRLQRMAGVKSWGYQLRLIDPGRIQASPFDLVVVDHAISAFRRFVRQFTPEEVAAMRARPDGSQRIVLSYLSIGEAERYRFYWDQAWYQPATKPAWLGEVNPIWDGNYLVRFWEPAWQGLIFGSPEAYVERIVAQGFDGIYLDRADVFLEWKARQPDAEARMVDFLVRLARHARHLKPDFLVVMQNAEELLSHASVRAAIDAIAKEDLYFGIDHKEGRNPADTVQWSVNDLRLAQKSGRRVLLVEYLSSPEKAADARRRAQADGFLLHVTARDLGQLTIDRVDPLPPPPPGVPAGKATLPGRG